MEDCCEGISSKLCPFNSRNFVWAKRLLEGYAFCLFIALLLAGVINILEGEQWMEATKGQKIRHGGQYSFDQCLWFTFTVLHGVAFGDFMTKTTAGDYIKGLAISISYWCTILMMAIVMLSQLPGVKPPSLFRMISQIASAVWPSYFILASLTVFFGHVIGPNMGDGISVDPSCSGNCEKNLNALGIDFLWTVVHRAPFGDVWPDTPFGRAIVVPAAIVGYLYPPYVLALIAIRRPTVKEHASLLEHMQGPHPEEVMGPGYVVPADARTPEFVQMAQR